MVPIYNHNKEIESYQINEKKKKMYAKVVEQKQHCLWLGISPKWQDKSESQSPGCVNNNRLIVSQFPLTINFWI